MKLQQAYVSENNQYGTWALIGYNAPGGSSGSSSETTNFKYDGDQITTNGTSSASGWKAVGQMKLNDCPTTNKWTVTVAVDANGVDSYTAAISDVANCQQLTPSFTKIGK